MELDTTVKYYNELLIEINKKFDRKNKIENVIKNEKDKLKYVKNEIDNEKKLISNITKLINNLKEDEKIHFQNNINMEEYRRYQECVKRKK